MKPIKIKISAFGPYSDEVFIDFTKFYDNGVFLITGDTGSGKTTIFDAICFALFGNASGNNREKGSFRSDFAKDDIKTYVEFEFSNKGVIYKITRSPNYMRKKIRGEGYTQVTGDASISYLDQVITGDKNVTDKCKEILGIDYQQFKQISMIAQGEFLKLLLAKPSERADIFRRIFDTYIYRNIGDTLKRKYFEKKREYEDIGINFDSLKDNVLFDEEKELDINTEELLELINIEISKDCLIEKEKEELKKDLLNKLQIITSKISNVMLINDSLKNYEESIIRLSELKKSDLVISSKRDIVDKNKMIYEFIEPVYQELIRIKRESEEKKLNLEKNKKLYDDKLCNYDNVFSEYNKLEDNRKKINILKDKIKEYENKLPLFLEINELRSSLESKKNIFNLLRLNELDELLDKFDRNRNILKKIDNEKDKIIKLKKTYDDSNSKYNFIYNQFINCQAGILASTLESGCPCPVCGSLEHPNKAMFDDSIVTKEKVDDAKKLLEDSQKEVDLCSNVISSLKKDLEISNKEIKGLDEETIKSEIENISNNIVNGFVDISNYDISNVSKDISYIEVQLENKLCSLNSSDNENDIRSIILNYQKEIYEIENKIKDIVNEYDSLLKEKVSLESIIKLLETEIGKLEKEIESKNVEYINSYSKLGYLDEEDYLAVKINKDDLSLLEKEILSFEKEISEVSSKIDTLKDFIKDKKKEDIFVLENEKNSLNCKLGEIDLFLKNLHSKINNNKIIYEKVKNVYQKTKNLERELAILEDLSNTANGSIKGKNKLEFEQYVQASYFDDVLVSANERFSYMTDSRYLLLRRVESTRVSDKLGLELEVFDNYTGKRRDITTLSGGESFKASLSLALGMSDVIQNYSGGIVVETMFIDEGFGSLDTESLEQAMNAIMMLSDHDRLIGIISHVNELKERIDKKIIVKKGNTGSRVNIVV